MSAYTEEMLKSIRTWKAPELPACTRRFPVLVRKKKSRC
jgi:hypothetical protein